MTYFPRRVSLSIMAVVVLLLLFQYFEVFFYEMTARYISYLGAYLAKRLAFAQSRG